MGELELTQVSARTTLSRDKDEYLEMVRNVLQLKDDDILPAIMKTTGREGGCTVESNLESEAGNATC